MGVKVFVDEIIALGNKWSETKSFSDGDFFREMFLKPSSEVKSELDEILRTRKQFAWERNVAELAVIELTQDLHRPDREVIEARQCLTQLESLAAAKWTAIVEARARDGTLIRQVEDADSKLRRKTWEYKRWQILWAELPLAEDESHRSVAFYGKLLKKRGLEAMKARAKSLLEELNLWLNAMLDCAPGCFCKKTLFFLFWYLHI